MFLIADLLDRAKQKAGIASDYKLAKLIGGKQVCISQYRAGKSLPAEDITSDLAALSGDDPDVLCAQIMAARAKSDTARALWLRVADRLTHAPQTAVLSVFAAIFFVAMQGQPAYATEAPLIGKASLNDLYIVFSALLSVSLLGCFYPPVLYVQTRTAIQN